jgi:hypothetical protein
VHRAGSFLRNIGREGKGPGELAQGEKFIRIDSKGRIYAGDNNRRWSVFGADFEYLRSFPSADFGIGIFECCAVLDDGTFLTSAGRDVGAFRIVDINDRAAPVPPLVRAFGPVSRNLGITRPVAYASGTTFWSGAPAREEFDYVLEQWSTSGTRLRSFRRDVPWIPRPDPSAATSSIHPDMRVLHDAGNGLLFVTLVLPLKAYYELTPVERRERGAGTKSDRAIHNYLEVIDVHAGVVLASIGPIAPSEARQRLPAGWFAGSLDGYSTSEDDNGFRTMHMVEARLVGR